MAKTPISGAAAYATPADLFLRVDPRVIADWVSVNGSRVGGDSDTGVVTEATLAADSRVLMALKSASGYVEMAALRGKRYTSADIDALVASASNATEIVKTMVCGKAIQTIAGHRLINDEGAMMLAKEASDIIKELASGEQILALSESAAAGLPDHGQRTPDQERERNGLSTQMSRYFGALADTEENPNGYE